MVVRDAIMLDDTMKAVRDRQAWLEWVKSKFHDIQDVRELAEKVFLQGELNIAKKLVQQPVAPGGVPYHHAPSTGDTAAPVAATVSELLGRDRKYGWRLRQIAQLHPEGLDSCAAELHRSGREATLHGIVQLLRMNERTEQSAWQGNRWGLQDTAEGSHLRPQARYAPRTLTTGRRACWRSLTKAGGAAGFPALLATMAQQPQQPQGGT
jgi:hypothetical protein